MLKKALKTCKKGAAVLLCTALTYSIAAQDSLQNSITLPASPSMPSLSMPKVGSGEFYNPSSSDFYTGQIPAARTTNKKNTEQSPKETDDTQTKTAAAPVTPVSPSVPLYTPADSNTQTSIAQNINTLTADNINTLSRLGLLGNLNSTFNNKTQDNVLQTILDELDSLKKQVGYEKLSATEKDNNKLSQILRFKVNGYDIKSTCRDVFISDAHADSAFMVSGDRRYQSDGKSRTETFYMLFVPQNTTDGITQYKVTTEVSQDALNEYSFLYQMSKRNDILANRTGNFVSLRTNDTNWRMDLLISLN